MQTATVPPRQRTFFDRMSSPSPAPTVGAFDPISPFFGHAANLQYATAAAVAAAAAAQQQRSEALTLAVLHIDRSHLLLRKLQQASTQLLEQALHADEPPAAPAQEQPVLSPSIARRLLTLEEAQLGAHRTLLRLHALGSLTANAVEANHASAAVLRSLSAMIMLRNWMASRAFAEGELQATEQQLMKAQAVIDSAPSEDLAAAALAAPLCAAALLAFQRVQAHTWCNLACVLRFTDPAQGVQWAKRALQLIRTTRGLHARSRAECAQDVSLFHDGDSSEASSSHFSLLFDLITPPPSLFDAYPIALLCTVDCLGELGDAPRAAKLAGKACAFLKADFERVRKRAQRRKLKREQHQQHQQQQQEDDDAETASILQQKALVIAAAYSTLAVHQSSLGQLDHAFVNYSSAHAISAHFLGSSHEETKAHEENLQALEKEWLSEVEAQDDARERMTMQQQQQAHQTQPPRMLYLRQHLTPRSEPPQQQAQPPIAWRPPAQPQSQRLSVDSRSISESSGLTHDDDDDDDRDRSGFENRDQQEAEAAEEWLSDDEDQHDDFDEQHSHHSYRSQVESIHESPSASSRSRTPSPVHQRVPSLPLATQNGAAAAATPSPREAQLARLASLTRGQSVQTPVDRPLFIEAAYEPSPHSIVAPVTPSAAARIAHTRGTSLELRRALSATPPAQLADVASPPPSHARQPSATGLRSTSLAPSTSRSQLHRRQDSSISRQPSAANASGSGPNSSRGRPAPLRLPSAGSATTGPVVTSATDMLPFLLRSPSTEDRPAEPLWLDRQPSKPPTPRTPAAADRQSSLNIPSSHNGSMRPSSSPRLQNASSSSASAASPRPRSPRPAASAFLEVGPRPSSKRTPSMMLVESIMQSVKIAEAVRKQAMEDADTMAHRAVDGEAATMNPATEYALELSIKKAQHDAIAATLAPEDAGRVDLICLMQEQTAAEMQHELAKSAHASSAEEQLRRKLLLGKQRKRNRRGPSMVEREFFAAAGSPKLGSPKSKHLSRPSWGGNGVSGGGGGGHARNPSLARLLSRTGSISLTAPTSAAAAASTSPPVTSADVMDAALSAVLIAEAVRNDILAAHAHDRSSPAELEARIHEAQSQAIVDSLAPDEQERATFLLMLAQSAQHQTAVKQHAASQAAAQESEWQQKLARGKNRRARS